MVKKLLQSMFKMLHQSILSIYFLFLHQSILKFICYTNPYFHYFYTNPYMILERLQQSMLSFYSSPYWKCYTNPLYKCKRNP